MSQKWCQELLTRWGPKVAKSGGVLLQIKFCCLFGVPKVAKSYGELIKNMLLDNFGVPKAAKNYGELLPN